MKGDKVDRVAIVPEENLYLLSTFTKMECHDSRNESTSQAIKNQVDCIYKFYLIYKINKI